MQGELVNEHISMNASVTTMLCNFQVLTAACWRVAAHLYWLLTCVCPVEVRKARYNEELLQSNLRRHCCEAQHTTTQRDTPSVHDSVQPLPRLAGVLLTHSRCLASVPTEGNACIGKVQSAEDAEQQKSERSVATLLTGTGPSWELHGPRVARRLRHRTRSALPPPLPPPGPPTPINICQASKTLACHICTWGVQ